MSAARYFVVYKTDKAVAPVALEYFDLEVARGIARDKAMNFGKAFVTLEVESWVKDVKVIRESPCQEPLVTDAGDQS